MDVRLEIGLSTIDRSSGPGSAVMGIRFGDRPRGKKTVRVYGYKAQQTMRLSWLGEKSRASAGQNWKVGKTWIQKYKWQHK